MSLRVIGGIHVVISSFSSWSSSSMSSGSSVEPLRISQLLIFSLFNSVTTVIIFFLIWSIILTLWIISWNASIIALDSWLPIITLCRDSCLRLRCWCIISKLSFKSKHSNKISRSFNFLMINGIFILPSKLFILWLVQIICNSYYGSMVRSNLNIIRNLYFFKFIELILIVFNCLSIVLWWTSIFNINIWLLIHVSHISFIS